MGKTETAEGTAELKDRTTPQAAANLPVVLPKPRGLPVVVPRAWLELRRRTSVVVLGVVGVALAIGLYWGTYRQPAIPLGIAYGNGRLEADPIYIATKFAGRIYQLRVDEGDKVTAGQTLAVMDTRDLAAALKKAEAQVEQARKAVSEAAANIEQAHSQVTFAEQEIARTRLSEPISALRSCRHDVRRGTLRKK